MVDDVERPDDEAPDAPGETDRDDRADQPQVVAWSPTRLEARSCLFRFWKKYVEKSPESGTPILQAGNFVHRCLELYIGGCVDRKTAGDPLLAEAAVDAASAEMMQVPIEVVDDARHLLRRLAEEHEVPFERVVGTELRWAANREWQPCGWDDPEARWRGIVDMYSVEAASASIVDHKSHRAAMAQRAVDRAWAVRVYACLALAHNPSLAEVEVDFHFVRSGIHRTVHHTLSDLMRVRDELDREADRSERFVAKHREAGPEAWPASPGLHCGICSYQTVCPKREQVKQLGIVTTPEEAEAAAREVLFLEATLRSRRKALSEYVRVAEPVVVDEVMFDHFVVADWKVDTKQVIDACRRHGVPLDAVLKPDRGAILRVGRTAEGFRAEAEQAMTDRGKTVFRWRKLRDDEEEGEAARGHEGTA